MNWIKNFLKPKIKSLFKKKSSELEESLWITCVDCKALIMKDEFKNNLFVCPKCNSHRAKVEPRDRFSMFFDNNYFETLDQPIALNDDPLNFKAKKNYKAGNCFIINNGLSKGTSDNSVKPLSNIFFVKSTN